MASVATVCLGIALAWIWAGTGGRDRAPTEDLERQAAALERATLERRWSQVEGSEAAVESPSASAGAGASPVETRASSLDPEADAPDVDDGAAGPSRAFMRSAFESAVAEHFPDRRLSSDEVERVTDSLMDLREAKEALRTLPIDAEHAEQRRRLVERIGEASDAFRDVMDITPSEFTTGAGPGIDRHDADEAVPEPEFLDPGPRAERATDR